MPDTVAPSDFDPIWIQAEVIRRLLIIRAWLFEISIRQDLNRRCGSWSLTLKTRRGQSNWRNQLIDIFARKIDDFFSPYRKIGPILFKKFNKGVRKRSKGFVAGGE